MDYIVRPGGQKFASFIRLIAGKNPQINMVGPPLLRDHFLVAVLLVYIRFYDTDCGGTLAYKPSPEKCLSGMIWLLFQC